MHRIERVAAVLVLVAAGVVAFLPPAREPARVGPATLVNREGPADTGLSVDVANSPTVVRNPYDPDNVVVGYRTDYPGYNAGLRWSADGGATWATTDLPLPPEVAICGASPDGKACPFAPDIAFGIGGTMFVSYVHLVGDGNRPGALWLARSTDGGRTLSPPVKVAEGLVFQARLVADLNGPVYLVWLQAHETNTGGFTPPYPTVVAARSETGGASFERPVRVSDPGRERVLAGDATIDSDGQLVVLYQDLKGNRRDFENLEGPPDGDPTALVITRSVDGGRSFEAGTEVDSGLVATHRFLVYLPQAPTVAAGPNQRLYIAWADGRDGSDDVLMRSSKNAGRTWSAPVRVNDNPVGDGTGQFLPRVAVGPGGEPEVLFLDGRNDPEGKVMVDAYLATTTSPDIDEGTSFRNTRVSPRSFSQRVGPTVGRTLETDLGSRLGLDSTQGKAIVAWVDTSLGNETSGSQDVAVALVSRPPPASRMWRWVVALGLALVALTTLVVRGDK